MEINFKSKGPSHLHLYHTAIQIKVQSLGFIWRLVGITHNNDTKTQCCHAHTTLPYSNMSGSTPPHQGNQSDLYEN